MNDGKLSIDDELFKLNIKEGLVLDGIIINIMEILFQILKGEL